MKVDVRLPSGAGLSVAVSPEALISELKATVQQHFKRRLKLVAKGLWRVARSRQKMWPSRKLQFRLHAPMILRRLGYGQSFSGLWIGGLGGGLRQTFLSPWVP